MAPPGFARERGLEAARQADFATPNAFRERSVEMDTVDAVAREAEGRLAVAVSTGGARGKLPGRLGDRPLPGAVLRRDHQAEAVEPTMRRGLQCVRVTRSLNRVIGTLRIASRLLPDRHSQKCDEVS